MTILKKKNISIKKDEKKMIEHYFFFLVCNVLCRKKYIHL